jgi:hypothetical protein
MKKVRSITRAMKRGHLVSFMYGTYYSKKPFNNRKNSSKRGKISRNYGRPNY